MSDKSYRTVKREEHQMNKQLMIKVVATLISGAIVFYPKLVVGESFINDQVEYEHSVSVVS